MTLSHNQKKRILLSLNRYATILHSKALMDEDRKSFKDSQNRFLEVQNFAADFAIRLFDGEDITEDDKTFLLNMFYEKISYLESVINEEKWATAIKELNELIQILKE